MTTTQHNTALSRLLLAAEAAAASPFSCEGRQRRRMYLVNNGWIQEGEGWSLPCVPIPAMSEDDSLRLALAFALNGFHTARQG